jgi:Leucine-rich repeat (LRR) protein
MGANEYEHADTNPEVAYRLALARIRSAVEGQHTHLDLTYLALDRIPDEIAQLGNCLESLEIGLPDFYRHIHMGEAAIKTLEPLRGLNRLQKLSIEGMNGIDDISPLAALSHLSLLRIDSCHKIRSVNALSAIEELEDLSVTFSSKENLQETACADENIGGQDFDFSSIAGIRGLKKITFVNARINFIPHLSPRNELCELHFSRCEILDIGALGSLSRLRKLTIEKDNYLTALPPFFGLSEIEEINIHLCTNFRSKIIFNGLLRVPQQMTLPFAEIAHQPGVMRYETVNKKTQTNHFLFCSRLPRPVRT